MLRLQTRDAIRKHALPSTVMISLVVSRLVMHLMIYEVKFMSDNRTKGSMTEGSPVKCMLAIPMILGNLFQQFYNLVDSMIVGKLVGADALAAVGASTAITMLFVMIAVGTGIGCSVVISQLFGAEKIEEMKTAISTALLSIVVFSSIIKLSFPDALCQKYVS